MPPPRVPPLDRWFVVEVTAKSGSGASAEYEFVEVWVDASPAVATKTAGRYGTATNYGFSVGAELAVGDRALCRSADGAGGLLWELVPYPMVAGGGGGGDAHYLAPVRVVSTGPLTLSSDVENGDTIDGVTLATGDRVLLAHQSTATENGVYDVPASGAPTRSSDADSPAKLHGACVAVLEGDTGARTLWTGVAPDQPTLYTNQIWERKGNTVYRSPSAAYGGIGRRPIPMRSTDDSANLTAVVDDSPAFYHTSSFSNGTAGTYASYALGVHGSGGPSAAGALEVGTAELTAAGAFPDGADVAAGLTYGPLNGLIYGLGVSTPLVLRIVGTTTDWTYAELGARTRGAGGTDYAVRLQFYGDLVRVTRGGTTTRLDTDGGYSVGGVNGVTGTLGPGATALGGMIDSLGSGSYVGTASSNAFTNTNSFSAATTFTGTVASQNAATFTPTSAATVPATIQGAASQSANLLEAKTNGGSVVASISAAGAITGTSLNGPYDAGTW